MVVHLQFEGLVHYHHNGKEHSMEANTVLDKQLRVVHQVQVTGSLSHSAFLEHYETSKPTSTRHISSYKIRPPDRVTPLRGQFSLKPLHSTPWPQSLVVIS